MQEMERYRFYRDLSPAGCTKNFQKSRTHNLDFFPLNHESGSIAGGSLLLSALDRRLLLHCEERDERLDCRTWWSANPKQEQALCWFFRTRPSSEGIIKGWELFVDGILNIWRSGISLKHLSSLVKMSKVRFERRESAWQASKRKVKYIYI